MGLADAISLRSRRRKLGLFMDAMRPTAETSVLDVGVDDLGFGESSGCGDAELLRGALPLAAPDHGAGPARGRRRFSERYPERALRAR